MKEKPLVSIIIPVYNVEKFLNKCILSVVGQTYSNTEILLVDDGSTDNSGNICRKYAKRFNNIEYLYENHSGESAARNYGLDTCKGNYILFVDSDDFVRNNLVESVLKVALKENADIVEFDYLLVKNKDKKWPNIINDYKVLTHNDALKRCLNYESNMVLWNRLYKRSLFKNVRFPVGMIFEDEATIPYLVDKANIYVKVNNCYYAYVQRQGSIMHSEFNDNELFIIDIFQQRLIFFNKKYNGKYNNFIRYHFFLRLKNLLYAMPKHDKTRKNIIIYKKKLYRNLLNSDSLDLKLRAKAWIYNFMPMFIYALKK